MKVFFLRVSEGAWRFPSYNPSCWGLYIETVYHGITTGPEYARRRARASSLVPLGNIEVIRSGRFVPSMAFPSYCGPIVSPAIQDRLLSVFSCTFVDVIWSSVVDLPFPHTKDVCPQGGAEDYIKSLPHREDLLPNLHGFREWFAPELRLLVDFATISPEETKAMKDCRRLFRKEMCRRFLTSELLEKHPAIKSYGGFMIRGDLFAAIKPLIDTKILGAVSAEAK